MFGKKFNVYVIFTKDTEEIVGVVDRKDEIDEFLRKYVISENEAHYKAWCNLRGKNPKDVSSEEEYIDTRWEDLSEDPKYRFVIQQQQYNQRGFASMLRMFYGVKPRGCSYESEVEIEYFNLLDKELNKAKNG